LDTLCDPASLDALKIKLLKRSKKRQRERRRRALHQEAVKESHTRRQHLHQNIDTWLKNMQEVVEEAKRVSPNGSVIGKQYPCFALPSFNSLHVTLPV
jgi:indole-3-glycerol phosphate synthase